MIHRQLPGAFGIGKAKVQRGLAPVKVAHELPVPAGIPLDEPVLKRLRRWLPGAFRPDVPVGVWILFLFAGFLKPGMFNGGITGDEVKQHLQPPLVRFLKKAPGVFIGAVPGGNLVIIGDIIPGIVEWRGKERVEPDAVHAEAFYIIQFLDNALQIADAVPIGIVKGLRIDLVKNRVVNPFRARWNDIFSSDFSPRHAFNLLLYSMP